MDELSNQRIFDECWTHLVAQGAPSKTTTGSCLYRSPEGRKCAAGFFIPDAAYTSEMDDLDDGTSVNSIHEAGLLPAELVPFIPILSDLQDAHDDDRHMVDKFDFNILKSAFVNIAAEFHLDGSILTKVVPQQEPAQ